MHWRGSTRFLVALLAALALGGGAAPLVAQGAPDPGDGITIVLLTMGPGDQVWEKFGHDALWVHDERRGTDRVYNWGVFDFNSPGYWSRFIRGTWIYQLAEFSLYQTMLEYEYFNRTVVAQELNLTPAQERDLAAFLEWNARPENREYRYDYYRDNCATRVRDAIDRVLGGALRRATEDVPTGTSYRWHTRRLMTGDPAYYVGLEAGLGPAADRPISAWEEMFLPEKVMERVRELKVPDEGGRMVPLVRSERVLVEAVGRPPEATRPPRWLPWFLLVGLAIGGAVAALEARARRGRAARFGYSALTALWTMLMGTGGLLLVGLWAFTDHTIAHRNENLFQFSPLALPLVLLLPAAAYGARWAARPARWLALALAASSILGLVLQVLPGLDQVNGEIIAALLPVNVAIGWTALRGWGAGMRADVPAPRRDPEPGSLVPNP